MAPVTRRRSRESKEAQKSSQESRGISSDAPIPSSDAAFEVTTPGKRKTASDGEDSDAVDSPEHTSPKRQKLAVRVREEEDVPGGTRSVHIEAKLLSQKSKRTRSLSIADSQDDGEGEEEGEPTPLSASKQLQEEASQQLSSELLAAEPGTQPTPVPAARKSKHVVFGDDEDVDKFVAAAAELQKTTKPAAVEEDDDESDDEAPEAVSTSAAARDTFKTVNALSKVADKQAAFLKRKRQERDNLFKQQAEKRKRVEKPAVHQSKRRKDQVAGLGEDADADDVAEVEKATTSGRRRAEKVKLPSILPAEFLTDSESGDEDERALRVIAKPKKIKFEEAVQTLGNEGRAPRDQIVGSTAYRVMAEQGNLSLAPKAHKNAKNVKEMLMRRRRVGVAPAKAKGFFRRK